MTTKIRGVLAPVVTPFHADGSVHFERLLAQCHWLCRHGVGLAVLGTNSEANSLSLEERLQMLDFLVNEGIDPKAMMPGTGACDLPSAIALTRRAVELGCAGVLTLPPFYYKGVSDEGLFRYYAGIIEAVDHPDLRLYLYHIPQVSGVPISLELIDRLLATYPGRVAGIKDSSGDWSNTEAMLSRFGERNFDVFPGSEEFLLRGLRAGGAGCISATANVNPGPMYELFTHYEDHGADKQQEALNKVRGVFQGYVMIAAMKEAIAHWRKEPDWRHVRPPLMGLTVEQSTELFEQLQAIGFEMDFS